MILSLFGKKAKPRHVYAIYNAIVAQSRQPFFYTDLNVPDTVNGRFDMISLHLCVLFRRLKTGQEDARVFSQAVFDLFFKDMDQSLREMGAGDTAVPKRIQQMGELFYGVLANLTSALDERDRAAITAVISRNVFDGETPDNIDRFTDYILALEAEMKDSHIDKILSGVLEMKAPA